MMHWIIARRGWNSGDNRPKGYVSVSEIELEKLEAEVSRLRNLEGTDDHPEHRCDRCGGRNIRSWYADSDVWNRIAGDFSILCPICFSELAKDAGMEFVIWRLSISGDDPEVSKLQVQLHDRLEELGGLQSKVERLRKHVVLLEGHVGSVVAVGLSRQHAKESKTNGE